MTTKIKAGVIGDGVVGTTQIADDAITSALIADNAVGIPALAVSDGSNGQVLTTNGSGTLSFSTVSGTTINNNADNRIITGSGTANTLEGESNFTFDGTTTVINNTGNADSTLLQLKNTPSTAGTYKTGLEFWSNEGTANNQTFNAGRIYSEFDGSNYANTRLTLGSASGSGTFNDELNITNGNVGIGTSDPGAKLDIRMSDSNGAYGRGLAGNLNLENTNTSVTEGGWLSISGYVGNATSRYQMGAITGGKQTTAADGDYGSYLSFWNTSGGANGESNSAMYERMRIDSSGNVGIGTSSPNANAKLDVNGVIRLYNASSNPTAVEGGIYYNTSDAQVKVSNGTIWAPIGSSALPSAVSSLYCWWDLSGVYSTIGSSNSTVTDASGNGYTLTETRTVTAESFPSGRSGMRTGASGAGNYFTSSAIPASGGAARTLFAIIYNLKNTSGPYQHIMHYGTNSTNQAFGMAYKSTGVLSQHTWAGDGATVSYTQGRTGSTGVSVIFSIYDGTTGKIRLYDAGSSTGSNATATYSTNTGTAYGIQVGSRIADSEFSDVVIGECGAYSKALTDSEMDTIAVGLLNRWT